MNGAVCLRKLKEGEVLNPLLFLGEEDYWLTKSLEILRRRLFTGEEGDFNRVDLEAGALTEGELLTALSTPPFLSPARMVILRAVDKIKPAAENDLRRGLEVMADGVYLIMTAAHLDQRRRFSKELLQRATVVECPRLKAYEAKKWVLAEAGSMKAPLSPEIAGLLVELRGASLAMLRNELEKALLYMGNDKKGLTKEEWMDLLGEATESNIFALIDRITEGETGAALTLLHQLLAVGEAEMKLLYLFGRQIRQLFQALALIEEGRGREALQKELSCHPYVAEKLLNQARKLSYRRLRSAHRRVLEADYRVKTGQSDPRLELEMTVVELTAILAV